MCLLCRMCVPYRFQENNNLLPPLFKISVLLYQLLLYRLDVWLQWIGQETSVLVHLSIVKDLPCI